MSVSKTLIGTAATVGALGVTAILLYSVFSRDDEPAPPAAGEEALTYYQVGQAELGIGVDPTAPRVGQNRLIIEIKDATGNPVTEIPVSAYAEMPAMGQMPAMRAPADVKEVAPGRYEGSMDLTMRGTWLLTVVMQDPETGDEARLRFDLATDRSDLELQSGARPVGDNSVTSARSGQAAPRAPENGGIARFRAGGFEVGVTTEPHTPRIGDNRLIVEVRDSEGNAVSNIDVSAHAEMPAMGAMPAMRAPADLEQTAPGRFEGSMNLSMRGEWPLTVLIRSPEHGEQRLQFDLATDRAGLEIAAGGVPVGVEAAGNTDGNVITIDNRRRQMIGIEIGEAAHRQLVRPVRAVGEVTHDERLLSQVTLKYDGYIGDLQADYVGAFVEQGQVLFTVYSPELLAAQQEYLETFRRPGGNGAEDGLLRAARQRLRLWDMADAEIEALEARGVPLDYIPIHAPRSGTLIERNIADGSAARMGQTLLTIADLSRVWIEAEVFEADLELMEEGITASITLPYLPGRRFEADVDYVYPYLQAESRTGRVRLTLENSAGELKPGMYAEVALQFELGERLSVPEEAVIVAGESRVVFVDLGDGRLRPTRIQTGRRAQGFVEVLDGLSAGDQVVTSGNFLLAAETRLKTGLEQW